MKETKERSAYIDLLRALAILIMLLANISPYFFIVDTPVSVRILYSMAAPTFVFLSGYSAFKFSNSNTFAFWRVLFAAVIIDIFIWKSLPFHSFDVLYVIAFTILSVHFFKKTHVHFQHIIFILVFLTWIIGAVYFPYRFEFSNQKFDFINSIQRLFIDGWFPLLPWILIGWTGMYFAKFDLLHQAWLKWMGLTIFLYGLLHIYTHPINPDRDGYLEIFYPVSLSFLCLSIGFITVLLFILKHWNPSLSKNNALGIIGRNSLFAYLMHCVVLSFAISKMNIKVNSTNLIITWSVLILFIVILCYAKEKYIPNTKTLPKWLRLLTGF